MPSVHHNRHALNPFEYFDHTGNVLAQPAVDAALDETLFTGGSLNRRLLGGDGVEQTAN
jgi:hypothetical protein